MSLTSSSSSLFASALAELRSSLSASTLLLIGLVAAASIWLIVDGGYASKTPPIPGPFRLPLLGSVFVLSHFISNEKRHQIRVDLARKYGKMFVVQLGSLRIIMLNDIDVIKEAFVTKGEIVSDRSSRDFGAAADADDLFGQGKGIANANYGQEFRERKTLTLRSIKDFGFGGKTLDERASEETDFLVDRFRRVADTGVATDLHQSLVHLAVSNVICSVVFGKRFAYEDPIFAAAVDGIRFLLTERSFILERIPLLRHLPLVRRMKAEVRRHELNILALVEGEIRSHEKDFDLDSPKDFVDLGLQAAEAESREARGSSVGMESDKSTNNNNINNNERRSSIGPDNIKKIIVDLFFAGTDTTAASLTWFLLYLIRFPEVQRQCQREIDAAVAEDAAAREGDHRMISVANISKRLPFTNAALLETQRISSIAGGSLPHLVRRDTTLGGYHVPRGSIVSANIRFLHLDDRRWDRPDEFRPERWLDRSTDPPRIVRRENFIPFSVGKRRCLGENLAKAEYSVFAVSLLRNFTFKMEDPSDPPSLKGFGLVYSPRPFKVVVETRSAG